MNRADMTPSELDHAEQREYDAQDEDRRDAARDELYEPPPCEHAWVPLWHFNEPPIWQRCRHCNTEEECE